MASKFNITAELNLQTKNLGKVVNDLRNQFQGANLNIKIKDLSKAQSQMQSLGKAAKAADKTLSDFGAGFAQAVKKFSVVTAATATLISFTRALKSGVGDAIEFERELIKVSQAAGKSASDLQYLSKEITKISTAFGASSKDLISVARTLTQAGISADKVTASLKILAQTSLTASFESIQDTTEGAIALLNQFGREAQRAGTEIQFLEDSLNAINQVSKSFAVESSDLITAIRTTGSAFQSAGGDLNELLALFTSVRSTTRESAESIATGFRTIFTRVQRVDTIQALKEMGIELQDASGKFVGPIEAVKRLSAALNTIDPRDYRFNLVVEQLGGFRQVSKVIPLIQQFNVSQRALNVAQESSGSVAKDAATAQQSLAVQIDKVREEFKALIREMVSTSTFQSFARDALAIASALIKVADSIKPLLPLLAGFAAIKLGQGFATQLKAITGVKRNAGGEIPRFASGGVVPGSGNSDTIPAMLTPGEFVIKKSSVKKLGIDNLARMNKYADGGFVVKPEAGKFGGFFLQPEDKADSYLTSPGISVSNEGVKNKILSNISSGGAKKFGPKTKSLEGEDLELVKKQAVTDYKTGYQDINTAIDKGIITQEQYKEYLSTGTLETNVPLAAQPKTKEANEKYRKEFFDRPAGNESFSSLVGKLESDRKKFNAGLASQTTKSKPGILAANIPKKEQDLLKKGVKIAADEGDVPAFYIGDNDAEKSPKMRKAVADITRDGFSRIIEDITKDAAFQNIGTPPLGATPETLANAVDNLFSSVANSARVTIEGYVLEGISSALTGAQLAGSDASWDFDQLTADNKVGLSNMFGGGDRMSALMSADAKRTLSQKSKSSIISKKIASSLAQYPNLIDTVTAFANGGMANGEDTVPAMLTPGEFVFNKKSAQNIGYSALHRMNKIGKYAKGGIVQHFANGGTPTPTTFASGSSNPAIQEMITSLKNLADVTRTTTDQTEVQADVEARHIAVIDKLIPLLEQWYSEGKNLEEMFHVIAQGALELGDAFDFSIGSIRKATEVGKFMQKGATAEGAAEKAKSVADRDKPLDPKESAAATRARKAEIKALEESKKAIKDEEKARQESSEKSKGIGKKSLEIDANLSFLASTALATALQFSGFSDAIKDGLTAFTSTFGSVMLIGKAMMDFGETLGIGTAAAKAAAVANQTEAAASNASAAADSTEATASTNAAIADTEEAVASKAAAGGGLLKSLGKFNTALIGISVAFAAFQAISAYYARKQKEAADKLEEMSKKISEATSDSIEISKTQYLSQAGKVKNRQQILDDATGPERLRLLDDPSLYFDIQLASLDLQSSFYDGSIALNDYNKSLKKSEALTTQELMNLSKNLKTETLKIADTIDKTFADVSVANLNKDEIEKNKELLARYNQAQEQYIGDLKGRLAKSIANFGMDKESQAIKDEIIATAETIAEATAMMRYAKVEDRVVAGYAIDQSIKLASAQASLELNQLEQQVIQTQIAISKENALREKLLGTINEQIAFSDAIMAAKNNIEDFNSEFANTLALSTGEGQLKSTVPSSRAIEQLKPGKELNDALEFIRGVEDQAFGGSRRVSGGLQAASALRLDSGAIKRDLVGQMIPALGEQAGGKLPPVQEAMTKMYTDRLQQAGVNDPEIAKKIGDIIGTAIQEKAKSGGGALTEEDISRIDDQVKQYAEQLKKAGIDIVEVYRQYEQSQREAMQQILDLYKQEAEWRAKAIDIGMEQSQYQLSMLPEGNERDRAGLQAQIVKQEREAQAERIFTAPKDVLQKIGQGGGQGREKFLAGDVQGLVKEYDDLKQRLKDSNNPKEQERLRAQMRETETALETLAESTTELTFAQEKEAKAKAGVEQIKSAREAYAFGSDDQRSQMIQSSNFLNMFFKNPMFKQMIQRTGLNEAERQGVMQYASMFKDVKMGAFGGRTGQEVIDYFTNQEAGRMFGPEARAALEQQQAARNQVNAVYERRKEAALARSGLTGQAREDLKIQLANAKTPAEVMQIEYQQSLETLDKDTKDLNSRLEDVGIKIAKLGDEQLKELNKKLGELKAEEVKLKDSIETLSRDIKELSKKINPSDPELKLATGGLVHRADGGPIYASRGTLVNFKPKGTDTIPAMLSAGEYVIRKSSVDKYGKEFMDSINSGNFSEGAMYAARGGMSRRQYYKRRAEKRQDRKSDPRDKRKTLYIPNTDIPYEEIYSSLYIQGANDTESLINSLQYIADSMQYQPINSKEMNQLQRMVISSKVARIKNSLANSISNLQIPVDDARYIEIREGYKNYVDTNNLKDLYGNADKNIFGSIWGIPKSGLSKYLLRNQIGEGESDIHPNQTSLMLPNFNFQYDRFIADAKDAHKILVFRQQTERDMIEKQKRQNAKNKSTGGVIYRASGGDINFHPGEPKGTDDIPAWLTEGEFVVNARSTKKHRALLEQINRSKGGPVYAANGGIMGFDGMKNGMMRAFDSLVSKMISQFSNYTKSIQQSFENKKWADLGAFEDKKWGDIADFNNYAAFGPSNDSLNYSQDMPSVMNVGLPQFNNPTLMMGRGFANGGNVFGKGVDKNLFLASDNEFVVNKKGVNAVGPGFLNMINKGEIPGFYNGGFTGNTPTSGSNYGGGSGGNIAGSILESLQNGAKYILDAFNQGGLMGVADKLASFSKSIETISNINMTHTVNLQGSVTIAGVPDTGKIADAIRETVGDMIVSEVKRQINTQRREDKERP